ncbi:MAG: hypothetical protein ACJAQ2_001926 [Vicingaceae bacterium]|jgi:hypothetical protein
MRTEKVLLIAIIFSILLTGCSDRYPEHPDYTLTAEQTGYFSSTLNSGELWEQFGLTLKLSQKSGELMPIYLMSCSWTDHTNTNDPNIDLGTSCDANFMTWISLNEDEYLELTTIAHSRQGYNPTSSKFRIALIAIDTTELDFGFYLTNPEAESYLDSMKSQRERFIWSNEIQLKRMEKQEELPWGRWEKKKASNKR